MFLNIGLKYEINRYFFFYIYEVKSRTIPRDVATHLLYVKYV